jgi:dihydroceramidase
MIYCSCVAFYAVFSPELSRSNARYLLAFVVSIAIFISSYYHFLQNPVFHQTMFAIIVAIVSFKNMYTMETKLRPSRQPSTGSTTPPYSLKQPFPGEGEVSARSKDDRARESLKQMWLMVACGIGTIGLGFLVWNLDTIYCSKIRRWRREVGLPWGVFSEGHAWWFVIPSPCYVRDFSVANCMSQAYSDRTCCLLPLDLGRVSALLSRK